MNKQNVLLFFSLTVFFVKAQTVTPNVYSNGGNYNTAAGGSISWTVGEPISETYTTSTNKTTMGFHQPELGVATLIKEQGGDGDILVFPNPVSDVLSVSFKDLAYDTYKIEVLDALGKLIYIAELKTNQHYSIIYLNTSKYPAGIFYLRITDRASFNRTIKINKTL